MTKAAARKAIIERVTAICRNPGKAERVTTHQITTLMVLAVLPMADKAAADAAIAAVRAFQSEEPELWKTSGFAQFDLQFRCPQPQTSGDPTLN